jgi:hypothetical protein
LSKPVWATVPFLAEVQFPWRWLTIVSASGSIVFVAAFQSFKIAPQNLKIPGNYIKSFAAFALICVVGVYALMWFEFSLNHVPAGSYENYVAEKSESLGGEWFWTAKTKEEVFRINEKVSAEGRKIEIQKWQPTERVFALTEGNNGEARIATLFYPHWKASVNGIATPLKISDDGAILVSVPAKQSEVKIWFEEPSKIAAAKYLSLFTWLLFAGAGVFSFVNFRLKRVASQNPKKIVENAALDF